MVISENEKEFLELLVTNRVPAFEIENAREYAPEDSPLFGGDEWYYLKFVEGMPPASWMDIARTLLSEGVLVKARGLMGKNFYHIDTALIQKKHKGMTGIEC